MSKNIIFIILLFFVACQDKGVEPFSYESDTPIWLKIKIEHMSINKEYGGTTIIRYEWKGDYIFDIIIPISSCGLCEVYDKSGKTIDWQINSSQDYLDNRKSPTLVWKYSIN